MLDFSVNNRADKKILNKQIQSLLKFAAKEVNDELKIKEKLFFDVTFVDQETIHEINKNYRNKDKSTDVITFALWDAKDSVKTPLLGEIFLSIKDIEQKAIEQENDLTTQIIFSFIHGVLHLLGYDHIKKNEEAIMFKLQDKILTKVMKK